MHTTATKSLTAQAPANPTGKAKRQIGNLVILVEWQLRRQLGAIVIWSFSFCALAALIMVFFPSIKGTDINNLIKNYPAVLRDMFGMGNGVDLASIEGFLGHELFSLFLPIALAFFAILRCTRAICGAEEERSMDILLGNPLPRWQLVVATAMTVAVSTILIVTATGIVLLIMALVLDIDLAVGTTAAAVFNLWPITIFFAALALLFSAVVRSKSHASGLTFAVLVVMFFINSLSAVSSLVKKLEPLSVFHQYGSAIETGINWPSSVGITIVAVVLVAAAAILFELRDIYS